MLLLFCHSVSIEKVNRCFKLHEQVVNVQLKTILWANNMELVRLVNCLARCIRMHLKIYKICVIAFVFRPIELLCFDVSYMSSPWLPNQTFRKITLSTKLMWTRNFIWAIFFVWLLSSRRSTFFCCYTHTKYY